MRRCCNILRTYPIEMELNDANNIFFLQSMKSADVITNMTLKVFKLIKFEKQIGNTFPLSGYSYRSGMCFKIYPHSKAGRKKLGDKKVDIRKKFQSYLKISQGMKNFQNS